MTDRPKDKPPGYSVDEIQRAVEEVTRPRAPLSIAPTIPEAPAIDEPDQLPLSADILPEPARTWAKACAAWLNLDETMPTIAALCAAAAVLQGRVRVRWKSGVEEPVCLYWLVFSATGTLKSQVLSRATQAIRALEAERREAADADEKHNRGERRWREAQLQRLRRQKKPDERAQRQQWLQDMAELEAEIDQFTTPKPPEWLHGDVNPSLLPKILRHNYEAEGIARAAFLVDEGTFLANISGRHQGSTQVETLLSAINGAPLSFVRASQTTDDMVSIRLPATYMTICALVQPDYYDRLTGDQKLADSGFLGRTIRTLIDGAPRKPAFDSPEIPAHAQSAYDGWLRALATEDVPDLVDLTADATTGLLVASMYERIAWDGTGFSRRVLGLVCRVAAIVSVGSTIVCRQQGSSAAKNRHGEYDYLDEMIEEYPGSTGENEVVGGVGGGEGGQVGTGGALPLTRVLNDLFLFIYIQGLREVRATEQPAASLRSLTRRVWDRLPPLQTTDKRDPVRRKLRDLIRSYSHGQAPPTDKVYAALEELAEQGVIEWVPQSTYRYRGQVRYGEFRLLQMPPRRLRAVEGDAST